MKSSDEDLKHSMVSGNIKIGTAYKMIKDREAKEKINNTTSILDINAIHLMLTKSLDNINTTIWKEHPKVRSYDDYENLIKYLSSYIEEITEIKSTLEKKTI